ncbi:MAG: hypothetical protein KatS3mg068_0631 [Candidatus Sericytochromatia bacterium]|nr:MAG: hypothetical protein KatS3mg068_0631 [Candidatus Sericytochromatia bacterium]
MKKSILSILLPILLISCNNPNSSINNNNSNNNSFLTNTNISLSINVINGHDNQPIKNALVKITSTNGINKKINTNDKGISLFSDIISNYYYDIEVEAEGFISNKTNIKIDSNKEITIKLYKNIATLKGRILSENDTPIENAVIKVGNNFTLTNKNGDFSFNINSLEKLPVNISKNGFDNFIIDNIDFSKEKDKDLGNIKLHSLERKVSILFDNRSNLIDYLDKLIDILENSEYNIKKDSFSNYNLENIDILVLAAPNINYNPSDITKLQSFIRMNGKKIIILGEWGGYGNFYSDSINILLKEFNLKINQDLVRDNSNFESNEIVTNNIQSHYITNNVSYVSFYSTSSLEILNSQINQLNTDFTKNLIYTSSNAFKIQQYTRGQQALLSISLAYGTKLVLIGDTSLFTSDDSNGNGISNIDENDNKILALNIFSW